MELCGIQPFAQQLAYDNTHYNKKKSRFWWNWKTCLVTDSVSAWVNPQLHHSDPSKPALTGSSGTRGSPCAEESASCFHCWWERKNEWAKIRHKILDLFAMKIHSLLKKKSFHHRIWSWETLDLVPYCVLYPIMMMSF